MTVRRALVVAPLAVALFFGARSASAWCRTTTDESFVPTDAQPCDPNGDPLFWASTCVSYRMNQQASVQLSFDQAKGAADTAFKNWSSVDCPSDPVICTGGANGKPSIAVSDGGPTTVHAAEYKGDGTDENVILFWDSGWPHADPDITLALTTVTFSTTSGELYDADIEVNSNPAINPLTVDDPTGRDVYDLPSIFQHETGHFLGLAHTDPKNTNATMAKQYKRGSTTMRTLSADDICGICDVYPANRNAKCADGATKSGCHCALVGGESSGLDLALGGACAALILGVARRRSRRRSG